MGGGTTSDKGTDRHSGTVLYDVYYNPFTRRTKKGLHKKLELPENITYLVWKRKGKSALHVCNLMVFGYRASRRMLQMVRTESNKNLDMSLK